MSRLWTFLMDRCAEVPDPRERDALAAVLAEHTPRSEGDESCRGCGFSTVLASGFHVPRVMSTQACPTLRALAWRWCDHSAWRREWSLPLESGSRTWPPSENCFCGGPEETLYAHRRGTRRHCRLSKWERENTAAGAVTG